MSQNSVLLAVSAPPYWHCGRTIQSASLTTLLALLPAAAMAVWQWGMPAARVMALAIATGVVVEYLCSRLMHREAEIDDFSTVVSSLLFAFLLPAAAPWWLVVFGAILCISLGKMAFGGLGANPINTALVGWAMLSVSWPTFMDPNAMQLHTDLVDPLIRLKFFGASAVADIPMMDLVMGKQIGGLGASQAGALLLGGAFAAARGVIRWEIAASFLLGVIATAAAFYMIDPSQYAMPQFHVLTGSTILGAFFLATEWATSPGRQLPMILYGLVGGILVIIIRVYGIYPDGVPFAIMLINLLAPLFDSIHPKPFGVK